MPTFLYKAKTLDGYVVEGTLDAANKKDVQAIIRQQQAFPLEIEEKFQSKDINIGSRTISIKNMAIFCQQFASLIKAGVPYVKCLDLLRKQTDNKLLKHALENMQTDIQSGTSLSDSMESMGDTFPEVVIHMVRAGEASGTLENVMERLGINFEKQYRISQRIKSAMIYPIVIGSIALLVCFALVIFIVPTFADVFRGIGADLPFLTKVLIAFSDFTIKYGFFVVLLIILFAILYRGATSKGINKINKDKRKTVGKGIIKKMRKQMITSNFCRTLSGLLASGVSFTDSLVITSRILDNAYAERIVLGIEEQVRRGRSLSSMLRESGYFPEMVEHLVGVGEETGTVDVMLSKAAGFYENEVDNTVSRLTSFFEPAMMIFLGVFIAIMVLAIVLPMFQMASLIGGA